jgi:hypothetical protein
MYTTAGFTLAAMSAKSTTTVGTRAALTAPDADGAATVTGDPGARDPASINPTSRETAPVSASVKAVKRRVTCPL